MEAICQESKAPGVGGERLLGKLRDGGGFEGGLLDRVIPPLCIMGIMTHDYDLFSGDKWTDTLKLYGLKMLILHKVTPTEFETLHLKQI